MGFAVATALLVRQKQNTFENTFGSKVSQADYADL